MWNPRGFEREENISCRSRKWLHSVGLNQVRDTPTARVLSARETKLGQIVCPVVSVCVRASVGTARSSIFQGAFFNFSSTAAKNAALGGYWTWPRPPCIRVTHGINRFIPPDAFLSRGKNFLLLLLSRVKLVEGKSFHCKCGQTQPMNPKVLLVYFRAEVQAKLI